MARGRKPAADKKEVSEKKVSVPESEKAKELYSFSIELTKEVEVTTETVDPETQEPMKVVKRVKKPISHRIRIAKPSRRILDKGALEYSKKLNEMMKEGLLTKAMVVKKYADTGGILTQEESKALLRVQKRIGELNTRVIEIAPKEEKTEAETKELQESMEELNALRTQLATLESNYSALFEHTADAKAMNHAILWFTLVLSEVGYPNLDDSGEEGDDVDWKPMFEGNTFDEKFESYVEAEDSNDQIYVLSRKKLTYFVSFWYTGAAFSREDFEELEKDIDEGKVE